MRRKLTLLLATLAIFVPVLVHNAGGLAHASGAQAVKLTVDATEAPASFSTPGK
jgi:hypothetical protein